MSQLKSPVIAREIPMKPYKMTSLPLPLQTKSPRGKWTHAAAAVASDDPRDTAIVLYFNLEGAPVSVAIDVDAAGRLGEALIDLVKAFKAQQNNTN